MLRKMLIGAAALTLSTSVFASSFTPAQTKDIQHIVHSYLLAHPEVLMQAGQELQARMRKKQAEQQASAIKNNAKQIFHADSPSAGPKNAPVVLVEFSDYQCSHCRDMAHEVDQIIRSGKARVIFKEFPIFGRGSMLAAQAALAANKQGKFLAAHDALMKAKEPLTKDSVLAALKAVPGLNMARLQKDMSSQPIKSELASNLNLAQALGLVGTPAFILAKKGGGDVHLIPGAVPGNGLTQLVEQEANE